MTRRRCACGEPSVKPGLPYCGDCWPHARACRCWHTCAREVA